jgi:hypothetical protein
MQEGKVVERDLVKDVLNRLDEDFIGDFLEKELPI